MLRSLLALVLLCSTASAQLTVQPGQNLQAAVDATPDGGWVLIFGGVHQGPIVIRDKSIALVGAAPWSVIASYSVLWAGGQFSSQQGWCIEARGNSAHVIIVHNARLSGTTMGSNWNRGGGPIRIDGYGAAWIVDTIAEGFNARDGDTRPSVPGIIYEKLNGYLLIERSFVSGGLSSAISSATWPNGTFYPGAVGISAPTSRVQLLYSWIRGGQGADLRIDSAYNADPSWRPSPTPCPFPGIDGGEGGNAIAAGVVADPHLAILEGGPGGLVTVNVHATNGTIRVPWGHQPNGIPF
jgi:hypothetical protein